MLDHFVEIDSEGLGVEEGFEDLGGVVLVLLIVVVCFGWG